MDYKDTLNLPRTDFPMKGDGPRREPEIQKFWSENKIYEKVLEDRKKNNIGRFLLHDGPPYLSSGNIHIGTALNKILKDIVVKYKTLQGYYSPYLPGFDCHGLPIESAISKDKKKNDSEQLSPLDIRKQCTEFVMKNRRLQEEKFKRLGVLGDWTGAYMTIYPKFEAQQLKLFGEMVNKGYIYRGLKPVYWCATCQTALAEAEVEYVENYKSLSVYVAFPVSKLSSSAKKLEKFNDLKVVIWTTTPWTLPGNMAICLHKDFTYVVAHSKTFGYLLVAEKLLSQFNNKISEECIISEKINGKDLEHSICLHPLYGRESPIILGEHVTLDTGTGCVHTAPGHGLEDFGISQKYKLKVLSPVTAKGILTDDAGAELSGLYVHKAGNQKVIELLQKKGALIKEEEYFHSYPHCWRSKTPIIFRATEQWFCSVEKFREKALKEIDNVKWIPEIGRNRIYSMVESRTDWCISRQRVWGVPIPAFYCKGCNKDHLNKQIVDHIAKLVEVSGTDIWWEKDTESLLPAGYKCQCGSTTFQKETDIMDVWFDSGSTHYSVVDQSKDLFDKNNQGSPSEMYLEGSDQHRGWFQSSLLTSVALKGKAPYKSVLTHGFVLDENGRKMSKSLGNVVDPEKVINEYGADILRLWVASTDYSSDMKIGQTMFKQLSEVYRNIRNTARFALSNLFDFDLKKDIVEYQDLWNIDKYALFCLDEKRLAVSDAFNKYEFYKYYQILQNFCALDLSGFYFDVVKDRLYTAGKKSKSRRSVQTTISQILNFLLEVLTPVLPHLAEDIWRYMPYKINSATSVLALRWEVKNIGKDSHLVNFINIRDLANKALEIARTDKKIGKSLEAKLHLYFNNDIQQYQTMKLFNKTELETIFIVSQIVIHDLNDVYKKGNYDEYSLISDENCTVVVTKADGEKCPRCWKYSIDIGKDHKHKTICLPCAKAVEGLD
ncbi:MAG: isoleucine--tRNA ligase [Candidatus Melainabacteria bacterium]|nr:isoleucine--tRNA ligase [Candidatus Melainabacteria bacterium]